MADITLFAFEHDSLMVKCDPRHGKCTPCSLKNRSDVAPKDVFTMKRTIEAHHSVCVPLTHEFLVWDQPPAFHGGARRRPGKK